MPWKPAAGVYEMLPVARSTVAVPDDGALTIVTAAGLRGDVPAKSLLSTGITMAPPFCATVAASATASGPTPPTSITSVASEHSTVGVDASHTRYVTLAKPVKLLGGTYVNWLLVVT